MYILTVSNGYPTDRYVGNGIFEFEQAKALAKAGHKVVFAAVDMRSVRRWRKWGFEHIEKEGIEIKNLTIDEDEAADILGRLLK